MVRLELAVVDADDDADVVADDETDVVADEEPVVEAVDVTEEVAVLDTVE